VAANFRVSVASVVKWLQRFRATGSAATRRMGSRQPRSLARERDWILERLATAPDLTLRAQVAELGERGVVMSYGSVRRIVDDAGLRLRKTPFATEQGRPDVARRRARWKRYRGRLDPRPAVFTGETRAKTNMTRLRGVRRCGRKLVAKVPQEHWRMLTFPAALPRDRIDARCVIDGPINGEMFLADVEHVLVPTLNPGDMVVIDNLGSHKREAVRRAIRAAGARLFFLPPAARQPRSQSHRAGPCQTEEPASISRRAYRRSHPETHRRTPANPHAAEYASQFRNAGHDSVYADQTLGRFSWYP